MAFAARPSATSKQTDDWSSDRELSCRRCSAKRWDGRGSSGADLGIGCDVAIKFCLLHMPTTLIMESARFKREARLIAALKHPNITAIHRNGESEGRPFLVFEYVPGVTLEERLKPGPLSPSDVLPWPRNLPPRSNARTRTASFTAT